MHATLKCATQTPRNAAVGLREVMSNEKQLLTAIALLVALLLLLCAAQFTQGH